MNQENDKIEYFQDILVNINGPVDKEVRASAKYSDEQYSDLLEKLYKDGTNYEFTEEDKSLFMDALRVSLEGIDDYEFETLTGKKKFEFLDLYGKLAKNWNINISKLKRDNDDSTEYQEKATQTGLLEPLSYNIRDDQ